MCIRDSAKGMYCYRCAPMDQWRLNTKFTPDETACTAAIVAKEGPLPVGAHTWRVPDDSRTMLVDGTLTLGLLVRLLSRPHKPIPSVS